MEDHNPQVPATDLPILNFIRQTYLPASAANATTRMSTTEIAEQIALHTGIVLEAQELHAWLIEKGYSYDTLGEMRMVWLMQEAG